MLTAGEWLNHAAVLSALKRKKRATRRRQADAATLYAMGKPLKEIRQITGYSPSTILNLASRFGVKEAGGQNWKQYKNKCLRLAREKGLSDKSTIADVSAAFPGLRLASILTIAHNLKIGGAGTKLAYLCHEYAKAKKIPCALDALRHGENVNMLPLRQEMRMATGEQFAESLLETRSLAQVQRQLVQSGFFEEEVLDILQEALKTKKRKSQHAREGIP